MAGIESSLGMEPLLNFVWALVTVCGLYLWFKHRPRATTSPLVSSVALAMLVVILFPVISVSDDLWSLQNPAEAVTCQRRDHHDLRVPTHLPEAAAVPPSEVAALSFGFERLEVSTNAFHLPPKNPALQPIQNRPPPAA